MIITVQYIPVSGYSLSRNGGEICKLFYPDSRDSEGWRLLVKGKVIWRFSNHPPRGPFVLSPSRYFGYYSTMI